MGVHTATARATVRLPNCQAAAAVAELDCLVSLAAAARELNYCRPTLTLGNELHITQGEQP